MAKNFVPLFTGMPACKLKGSILPSNLVLAKYNAMPFLGLTSRFIFGKLGCVDIYRIIDNHSVMTRLTLSDAQWAKIAPYCSGKETDVGRTAVNNRLFIEAVLWIVRTGSPWRDLPPEFGNWNSVYKRYRRWVKSDRFSKLFNALNDSDLEYAMIDGTIVKVHRHGQGAKGGLVIRQLANQEAV